MIELTDENFEKEMQNYSKPVLVDFWAEWCSPCSFLSPIMDKIAEEFKEKIVFIKVNIDKAPSVSQKIGIDRIPAVNLFKNGKVVSGFIGVQPETEIKKWLEKELR